MEELSRDVMYQLKRRAVRDRACALIAADRREYGSALALWLRQQGFRTDTLRSFYAQYGRGIYKLLDSTYQWAWNQGDHAGAEAIAIAFLDRTGKPAWKTAKGE